MYAPLLEQIYRFNVCFQCWLVGQPTHRPTDPRTHQPTRPTNQPTPTHKPTNTHERFRCTNNSVRFSNVASVWKVYPILHHCYSVSLVRAGNSWYKFTDLCCIIVPPLPFQPEKGNVETLNITQLVWSFKYVYFFY